MKNLIAKFKEDPEFAIASAVTIALTGAVVITAVAKLIGSSAYAVHAAKR